MMGLDSVKKTIPQAKTPAEPQRMKKECKEELVAGETAIVNDAGRKKRIYPSNRWRIRFQTSSL